MRIEEIRLRRIIRSVIKESRLDVRYDEYYNFLNNLVEKVRFHCNSPLRSRHVSQFHDALRLIKDQGSNCISLEYNEQNRPVIKLSESCPLSKEEKDRLEIKIEEIAYNYYKSPESERRTFGQFAQSIYSMIISAYSRSI